MEPQFVLNGSTLLGIGTVLGALSGAITFLFRKLVEAKDEEIKALQAENTTLHDTVSRQADMLRTERDYFRDMAFKALQATEKQSSQQQPGFGPRS